MATAGWSLANLSEADDEHTLISSVRSIGDLTVAASLGGMVYEAAREGQRRFPAKGPWRPLAIGAAGGGYALYRSAKSLKSRTALVQRWTEEDKMVLEYLKPAECPVILVVNKLDDVDDMEQLLPHVGMLSKEFPFSDVVPVSALTGKSVAQLEALIRTRLPEGDFFFEEDQLTDRSERFLAAEIVREKIMRQLGDEVPYSSTVELEKFEESEKLIRIHALVLVERDNQKAIVIGSKGSRLKKIGSEARADMEKLFGKKVMLEIWVKVKSGWSDDERALRSLGYDSPER